MLKIALLLIGLIVTILLLVLYSPKRPPCPDCGGEIERRYGTWYCNNCNWYCAVDCRRCTSDCRPVASSRTRQKINDAIALNNSRRSQHYGT